MISREKLEGYMHELELSYEQQGGSIWVVSGNESGLENVVVMMADPVVVLQVKVMTVPKKRRAELFEHLLRLNGSEVVHGAYALQGDHVVYIDTLEGESMDLAEFQASLDAIGVALSQHYHVLAGYRD